MKKKNYSIIIAIALIVILVVATLCMGCDKKDVSNPANDLSTNAIESGENLYKNTNELDVNQNVEWDDEGNKVNVSPNINKEKMTFGDFDMTDISFKYSEGITEFTANVKNNSEQDYPMGLEMKVIFYDKEKNVIFETFVMTSSLLANGQSNIQAKFLKDCSYADSFDIVID